MAVKAGFMREPAASKFAAKMERIRKTYPVPAMQAFVLRLEKRKGKVTK